MHLSKLNSQCINALAEKAFRIANDCLALSLYVGFLHTRIYLCFKISTLIYLVLSIRATCRPWTMLKLSQLTSSKYLYIVLVHAAYVAYAWHLNFRKSCAYVYFAWFIYFCIAIKANKNICSENIDSACWLNKIANKLISFCEGRIYQFYKYIYHKIIFNFFLLYIRWHLFYCITIYFISLNCVSFGILLHESHQVKVHSAFAPVCCNVACRLLSTSFVGCKNCISNVCNKSRIAIQSSHIQEHQSFQHFFQAQLFFSFYW